MQAKDAVPDLARLRAIASYDLQSERGRALLDDFARRAAEVLGWPLGLVSIVLDGAQWFAGQHGLQGWLKTVSGTPIEWSFCAKVVRTGKCLLVSDARQSEFCHNPLVERDGVVAYVGVPLATSDGHVLGSLCSIAGHCQEVSEEHLACLQLLADELMGTLYRTT